MRLRVLAAVLVSVLAACSSRAEPAFSLALHQHASMSEGIGSVEWHADRAAQAGVDGIWWTDHDWRIEHWRHLRRFDFEEATVNGTRTLVTEPDDGYGGEFRYWDVQGFPEPRELSVVDSLAAEGGRSLRVAFTGTGPGPAFATLGLAQIASRQHNKWSLANRVHLAFSLFAESLDAEDGKVVLEVTLSEHPEGVHVLRYVAGSLDGEGPNAIALPCAVGQWNSYDLDITAEAIARFTSGGPDTLRAEDNSLYGVVLSLGSRANREVVVFLDDWRIETDPAFGGPEAISKMRDFAGLYETMYPSVSHLVGSEISRYRAQPHLNAYTPDGALVDYGGTSWADSITWAVDQVHARDGAVSLNHIYGPGGYGDLNETPAQKAARILARKRELIASRAYRVDVLEVGYRVRHGIDLAGFLGTWDALTGNAIFLTGNGVTDSHGSDLFDGWGPWQPGNVHFENNFVTWLYAPALEEVALIRSMKGGRAFFGDPYVFDPDGTVDLVTEEGFPMGRVVLTDRPSHGLVVEIFGAPPTAQVRLLQGEIRENPPAEYVDVNYLRDEILTPAIGGEVFADTVTVDTTLPCFVRVEVEDAGTATAYSNPVSFVRAAPSAGIPGPRVAAALGEIRIGRADRFTLTDAAFLHGSPTRFVVDGDEEVPGLGLLEIDTGLLGEPDEVTGGGFTAYVFQDGILTLQGFTGAGSHVELVWGATGAASTDAVVDRLRLGPGRPNPFGHGTVAELALPRSAPVLLEVLDVGGRRVRVLVDERRERGIHRIVWDGRDSSGRSVASGVYYLRVTALGQTITAKAVRMR